MLCTILIIGFMLYYRLIVMVNFINFPLQSFYFRGNDCKVIWSAQNIYIYIYIFFAYTKSSQAST